MKYVILANSFGLIKNTLKVDKIINNLKMNIISKANYKI